MFHQPVTLQGNLIEERDPLGHKSAYGYDDAGRLTQVTDAKGGVKKLAYNRQGQLTRYTDCSGRSTQWEYDERGRLIKSTDAQGNSSHYRYTALSGHTLDRANQPGQPGNHPGQLEAVIHADKSQERFCHDAEGRLLHYTDALERGTQWRYTAGGLIHERIDAAGQRLGYRWDKLGRLVQLRNENASSYEFKYDPVGRLLQETGFDGQTTQYIYAQDTGVLQAIEEGERRTELKFDPMGRLVQRKARVGEVEQIESYGYYPGGQIGQAQNENARLQWFYDAAGNLVREHHVYQGEHFARKKTAVWHHRYDELNQRIGSTRPDGHKLEWLTYGAGHIHGLVLDGIEALNFERDELHREIYRGQGNALVQHQKYDPVGRLLEQQVQGAGPQRAMDLNQAYQKAHESLGAPAAIARRYRYDKAGQLEHIEDSRRGRLQYRYDPVGRLLQAHSSLGAEIFAFDPAGNIVTPGPAPGAAPRQAHQLPAVLDNLLKEYAGTTYSHDERGNLVRRVSNGQASTFEWDGFNRLIRAHTPAGQTSFAYDPLGRRIAKRSEREAVLFGWDGDTLAFESRTVRGGPQGQTQEQGQGRTVHYIHEPGAFVPLVQVRTEQAMELADSPDVQALRQANCGIYDARLDPLWNGELDDRESQPFRKEQIAYYQCDHLGTPQELTDHEGHVAWAAQYKAWGHAKEAISEAARKAGLSNPIRFQGQYLDEETGLHYNRYRYYDPHSGRFISRDPIGLAGGVHLHQYAPNPLQWVDPLGLVKLTHSKANNSWQTPKGLSYGQGSIHGNRVKHVLDHETQNTEKHKHSVFCTCKRGESLDTVDEAWEKRGTPTKSGPNDVYEVDMKKTVGTQGEQKVRIVTKTGTNEVITAHPIH